MADFLVTTLADTVDPNDGVLSLREALALANGNGSAESDSITFAAALSGDTLVLTNGQLEITTDGIAINGDLDDDGSADITISGNHASRVFFVSDDAVTTIAAALNGLIMQGGYEYSARGGGIYLGEYDAIGLTNSTVSGNSIGFYGGDGGGIFGGNNAAITLINSTVSGNSAGYYGDGGGISVGGSGFITLINSIVSGNIAGDYGDGGGICVGGNVSLTLINSTVSGNRAGLYEEGGGIFGGIDATITLTNSTVSGNSAGYGGGMYGRGATITLTNSTVTGNRTDYDGGGISNFGATTLTNSIVAGNSSGFYLSHDLFGDNSGELEFVGSNIIGSDPVRFGTITGLATNATVIDGTDLADLETVFAAVAPDPNTGVLSGVLADNGGAVETVAIKTGGIAHNTGDNIVLPDDTHDLDGDTDTAETLPVDARGFDRVFGTNVDIGAFEAGQLEVTTLADETAATTDLATELADGGGLSLREALALANGNGSAESDSITFAAALAGGTLFLSQGQQLAITTDGITIDGDIDGNGTPDITVDADSGVGLDDAVSRVFFISDGAATTIAATLNGLVIQDGSADGGGGIYVGRADALTLTNATVSGNSAAFGGGIFGGNDGAITLTNATVSGNSADIGGGIFGSINAALTLTNATVSGNSAAFGGGIFSNGGAITLTNATVSGNSARYDGGGIYNLGTNGVTTLTNSIVAGNAAGDEGNDLFGGFGVSSSDLMFTGHNVIGSDPENFDDVTGLATNATQIVGTDQAALKTVFAAVAEVDPNGTPNDGDEFFAGVLADNGGPVQTVALSLDPTNPARDSGDATLLVEATVGLDLNGDGDTDDTITTDARGFARNVGAGVDLGAFEIQNSDPTEAANTGLTVDEGGSATILGTQLDFNDAEQADPDITYTVTAATVNGTLFLNGVPLGVGDSFTQADIGNGDVTYTHDGGETTADSFAFDVSDGAGGTASGTFALTINPLNDTAGGAAGGAIQYIEDQAPTALDPGLTVTDPDDTHLEAARVSITGNFAAGQDLLAFTPQGGITGSYDAATGVLTLTGSATLAQYQEALRSVTYFNSSQNPSEAPRTVNFAVDDGGGLVDLGTVGVTVIAELDPPGDFNGDHTTDILWRDDAGVVVLWEMDGVNVLANNFVAAIPTYWHIIDADSDFDGDGMSDILWQDDAGVVVLWTMNGPNIVSNDFVAGPIPDYWHIEDTGDFTGDGRADVLWRDDAGRVVLWEMDGPTIVNNTLVADVPTTSQIEGVGDFTGDAIADILWRDDDGTVRVWEMDGATVVSDTTVATLPDQQQFAATGDFNGDARFDILWRDDDGTVVMWEMDGATIIGDNTLGTLPSHWRIADTGDYTGDLNHDILWRETTGTIVLWEMDGPTILDNSAVNTIPTHWQVIG